METVEFKGLERGGGMLLLLSACILMRVAWRINRKSWSSVCSREVVISLRSRRRGGTARMTGMLSWRAMCFLGKIGWLGGVVELLFM